MYWTLVSHQTHPIAAATVAPRPADPVDFWPQIREKLKILGYVLLGILCTFLLIMLFWWCCYRPGYLLWRLAALRQIMAKFWTNVVDRLMKGRLAKLCPCFKRLCGCPVDGGESHSASYWTYDQYTNQSQTLSIALGMDQAATAHKEGLGSDGWSSLMVMASIYVKIVDTLHALLFQSVHLSVHERSFYCPGFWTLAFTRIVANECSVHLLWGNITWIAYLQYEYLLYLHDGRQYKCTFNLPSRNIEEIPPLQNL